MSRRTHRAAVRNGSGEVLRPGFYGKLPSHGDFIAADLDPRFQTAFDGWIRQGLSAIIEAFPDGWKARFLNAPSWRFALAAQLCGPRAMAGVMVPSTDSVGRCFPLTIAAPFEDASDDTEDAFGDRAWFDAVEAMALDARRRDFDILDLRSRLQRMRLPVAAVENLFAAGSSSSIWAADHPAHAHRARHRFEGLPPTDAFSRVLLTPESRGAGSPSTSEAPPRPSPAQPRNSPAEPPRGQQAPQHKKAIISESAAALRLQFNVTQYAGGRPHPSTAAFASEDQALTGIVVPSRDGDPAAPAKARTVASVFDEMPHHDSLDQTLSEIKGRMGRAHALLVSGAASRAPTEAESRGASVALLAVRREGAAILWAGSARCYLLRDGMMRCLTRDHREVGMRPRPSRAIGAADISAMLEVVIEPVAAGDRFLLCDPALPRLIGDRSIAKVLLSEERQRAVDLLIQDALIEGTRRDHIALVGDLSSP
ncbi:type VI secretion system-associated protein TagF [Fulvimarina sp. MAC8]|uniref:type VI secretion system-associated protein TagF n=1 Tax=Fulvimarina sp. MAC8 TaxID=3162874 RepID=UPI0032ECB5C1